MRGPSFHKGAFAAGLAFVLLVFTSATGHTVNGNQPSVLITSVSGYAGHAFVYAQVTDRGTPYPAPTGMHESPYYSEWVRQSIGGSSCPWLWAVYVFDRATHTQVNMPSSSGLSRNYGTTTIVCASPSVTPVDEPPVTDASARLDLDLRVSISPTVSTAGSTSTIFAVLSSSLTQDLNLYLNMAIKDWRVETWKVEFGDGQTSVTTGLAGTAIKLPHVYRTPGRYDARVVASIAGHAQAAIYDRYGGVRLIERPFSVDIGNEAFATSRAQPARRYLPPQAMVTVTPALGISGPDPSGAGFRRIDVLRGALTSLRVHLLITREGLLTIDDRAIGYGTSHLTAWRLDGGTSDAPADSGTAPGRVHPTADLLRLQWNTPGRIERAQLQDYTVPVTLYVETRFPDAHVASYAIQSSFSVTVNFAAQSG